MTINALIHLSTHEAEEIKKSYKLTLLGKRLTQGSCGLLIGRMRMCFVRFLAHVFRSFLSYFFVFNCRGVEEAMGNLGPKAVPVYRFGQ